MRNVSRYCFLALAVCSALLIAAAGCRRAPASAIRLASFAGTAACVGCHQEQAQFHAESAHTVTMREVTPEAMGPLYPKAGPIEDTDLEIFKTENGLSMGFRGKPEGAIPMQYALGSERFAFTFVNVEEKGLFELRHTYFPEIKKWLRTPGQQSIGENMLGLRYNETIARHCLGCHSTALPEEKVTPDSRFLGIGCESCHGPGKAHVEAARAGSADLRMRRLTDLKPKEVMMICARCHRSIADVLPEQQDMTQRFQTFGLQKSECYVKSGENLSCVTCHDPHKKASTDRKAYEAACKSCHAPPEGFGPPDPSKHVCPVNPQSGCIPCHMPKRMIDHVILPISMSDHWIKVWQNR